MRAVVVGGAGAIGRKVASLLNGAHSISAVTIADRDPGGAAGAAAEIGGKVTAIWADFSNPGEVREIFEDSDLVIGCLGARAGLEIPLALAAIDARIPYIGNCDDWEIVEAMLELDISAAETGTLVVPGVGASPGLTNLMAIHAAREFDIVDEVHIAWVGSTNSPSSAEAVAHTLRSFAGRARLVEGGSQRFVHAGGGRELVWFPDPVGAVEVVVCRHPEPVMLRSRFPEARSITVKGSLGAAFLQDVMRIASRLGVPRSVIERSGGLPGIDSWLPGVGLFGGGPRWSALRVEVRGRRDEHRGTQVLGALDAMQILAAAPLAAIAMMIAEGEIEGSGVITPENAADSGAVFARLAEWGVKIARLDPADEAAA